MNNGWAVSRWGVMVSTADGGDNWQLYQIDSLYHLNALTFTDNEHGWAVGGAGWGATAGCTILHTFDGGQNWSKQDSAGLDVALWDL